MEKEQGISSEGGAKLSRNVLEEVIVARLIDEPPEDYPYSPFNYLLYVYSNINKEMRKTETRSNLTPELIDTLKSTLFKLRDLIVSYCGLVFVPEVIPLVI